MLIENKARTTVNYHGRVAVDLQNARRIKTITTRQATLNCEGRQSVQGELIAYDQLYIQVVHNPLITDNSPQIWLVEVTDTGIYKTLLGRFSIKKQVIQPRGVWLDPSQDTIKTLSRYFPKYDTLESLDFLLRFAVELLQTLPDKKSGIYRTKIPKTARGSLKKYGVIVPNHKPSKPREYPKLKDNPSKKTVIETSKATVCTPQKYKISSRVHIPTGDTRSGRF